MNRDVVLVALALAAALCVAPQTATPGVEVGSGPDRVGVDQTFTDPQGDSRGRLDIVSVYAFSSGDRLDFRVRTREKTINSNENIAIDIDTNLDGSRDYGFYYRGGGAGTLFWVRYPGATVVAPASVGTTSGQDFGITYHLKLSAMGSPARIRFNVAVKEAPLPDVWDWAPDTGRWEAAITATNPPPPPQPPPPPPSRRPRVASSFMRPSPPQAGDAVVVGARFVLSGGGAARGGSLNCDGSLGGAGLSGKASRNGGTGTCRFRLPASAAGKRFSGEVTLVYPSGSASVRRSSVVRSAERLVIVGPSIDGPPRAGQNFGATFSIKLQRPSGTKRVTSGEVSCTATVGGRPLGSYFSGFLGGSAVCSWNIPAGAGGDAFVGKITIRHAGLTATKTVRYRVS